VSKRVVSLDLLRGLVISWMALDHVRNFMAPYSPELLDKASFLFFLTRWITHFCAPSFVFLAGVGAALHSLKGDLGATRRFLITRGLWLMVLEATWVNFSWFFAFDKVVLGVLWAIGGAMVLLGLLSWLPRRLVGALGALTTLVLAGVGTLPEATAAALGPVTGLVFQPHYWPEAPALPVSFVYIIVPWWGVMALGWGFGDLVKKHTDKAGLVGLAAIALFVVLRAFDGYGDPGDWETQSRSIMTVADFINPSKYPPSLMFQLMTLGGALAMLPLLERWRGRLAEAFLVFGRVPLFFYLLHLPLIHALTWGWNSWRWGSRRPSPDDPLELWAIYALFAFVLVALWPVCWRWAKLKKDHPDWTWLRYL
jgi:uncharacterized membrane protein